MAAMKLHQLHAPCRPRSVGQNKTIADNAYVLPLFQFYQPVVWKSALSFKPHLAGFIQPQAVGRAGK